jgi:heme/copper-type cytochrome/quinol oxidase subunit 1
MIPETDTAFDTAGEFFWFFGNLAVYIWNVYGVGLFIA